MPMAAIEHTSLLDIHAVADRLGVNVRWVRRKVATRAIPFIKLGHLIRFDLAEIEAWLEEARVPTAGQLVDDERCTWVEGHAGGRGVAGPPFRPVSSIRSTRRADGPAARRELDGFDPPSAS
jgi:excisionase family DNA binding protein